MNYLAHVYLARGSADGMIGGLLGDFFTGRSGLRDLPRATRREVLVHRRVDAWTDAHPLVVAARSRFPNGLRR